LRSLRGRRRRVPAPLRLARPRADRLPGASAVLVNFDGVDVELPWAVTFFSLWRTEPVFHNPHGEHGRDPDGVWRSRARCGRLRFRFTVDELVQLLRDTEPAQFRKPSGKLPAERRAA